MTGGVNVDVLLGPAVPPAPPRANRAAPARADQTPGPTPSRPAPTTLAEMGGAVRYWLDGDARLHRLDALLGRDLPVRLDLERGDPQALRATAALGGRPVAPRSVTAAPARLLAQVPRRNFAAGGGRLTVTLRTVAGTVRGSGRLDWRRTVAHLTVTGAGSSYQLRADRAGVARRPTAAGRWKLSPWRARADANGAFDLDLLLHEALAVSGHQAADAAPVRATAVRLRDDVLGGVKVTVYEIPTPAERGVAQGRARLRYWIGADGVLRRLELRTRMGAFAQLDVRSV